MTTISSKQRVYETYIVKSRYARYLDEKNRRENWPETICRYFDFMGKHLKDSHGYVLTKELRQELEDAVVNLEVMPSMRALMTAGEALSRDHTAGYNCSYIAVDDVRAFDEAMNILMNGTGVGFSVERQFITKLPEVPSKIINTESVIVVEDSKEGWSSAFNQYLANLYSGHNPKVDYSKVRPAGARLKTFGGRASGPEPLKDLFKFCLKTFQGSVGRKMNSLECHDIMTFIGQVVVVGGVRRSAMISLSNLSDERMRHAKAGAWWEANPQRALANNSACYTEKPEVSVFMAEWLAMHNSKSGERGIFNREAAKKVVAKSGRRNPEFEFGTNPCCFTGDTLVAVSDGRGPTPIRDLAFESNGTVTFDVLSAVPEVRNDGISPGTMTWSRQVKTAVAKFTAVKPVFKVTLSDGGSFEATNDHPLATKRGNYVMVENSVGFPLEGLDTNDANLMVVSVVPVGEKDVYDLTVEDNHNFFIITSQSPNITGLLVHNSEIILRSKQFCNLSEGVAREWDTEATLANKVRLSTILGTFQSTLTHFPYLRNSWTENTAEERLLGISLTGVLDSVLLNNPDDKDLPARLERLRDLSIETNKKLAAEIGIPQSAATTCVKPSGCMLPETVIRTSKGDLSLLKLFSLNGHNLEDYQDAEREWLEPTIDLQVPDQNGDMQLVTKLFVNGLASSVTLTFEDGCSITCTPNHKLMTSNRGWVEASQLSVEDEICSR